VEDRFMKATAFSMMVTALAAFAQSG